MASLSLPRDVFDSSLSDGGAVLGALELVGLPPLMALTSGRPEIVVALIDGPVAIDQVDLAAGSTRALNGVDRDIACATAASTACLHGTFVAGVLSAKRGSAAPAICPGCTLLVRPVFAEMAEAPTGLPSADAREVASAIEACVEAGARIINLSIALLQTSLHTSPTLTRALDHAMARGVIVVAAAGNEGSLGGTAITSHRWVIPVAACDLRGRPLDSSNLGKSIARHGVLAPGEGFTSLGSTGKPVTFRGSSAAAPLATGAIALVWSLIPAARPTELRLALSQARAGKRPNVTPPLLDAWAVYHCVRDVSDRT